MNFIKNLLEKIKQAFKQKPAPVIAAPVEEVKPPVEVVNPDRGSLAWYEQQYKEAFISDNNALKSRVQWYVKKILPNIGRYQEVEKKTNVPWYLVAAIHGLEASFDFNTCLHNGDPLGQKTVHVPDGRGPFFTWEAAAIDSLGYEGATKIKNWSLGQCLKFAENYNGMGYFNKGLMSPYLWSCSTKYSGYGKYVRDHVYDPNAQDDQCGVATMFKELEKQGLVRF